MNTDEIKRLCMDAFMEGMIESSRLGSWNHAFEDWWESKRPEARYFHNERAELWAKWDGQDVSLAHLHAPKWVKMYGSLDEIADRYAEIQASELPPEIKP